MRILDVFCISKRDSYVWHILLFDTAANSGHGFRPKGTRQTQEFIMRYTVPKLQITHCAITQLPPPVIVLTTRHTPLFLLHSVLEQQVLFKTSVIVNDSELSCCCSLPRAYSTGQGREKWKSTEIDGITCLWFDNIPLKSATSRTDPSIACFLPLTQNLTCFHRRSV